MMTEPMNRERVSWSHIDFLVEQLAARIRDSGRQYHQIMGVCRGGLVPAVMLAHRLEIYKVGCIDLNRAGHHSELYGDTLIVDDISDTGQTSHRLNRLFPGIDIAVLFVKPMGEAQPNYHVKKVSQDIWLDFPWENAEAPEPLQLVLPDMEAAHGDIA